ncbi:hypothetical protein HK407_05g08550 [Ordospora pajunii]|uniref:uncharacterized protein n=1 Tax=Ordospora pajunii TaxID=3039483 RepID=UPI00295288C2|nr:uncharacterized protein HK407_05g08550 [Ordospora pajunii]KAH9411480.1 hypothetical protein HK407_05g08550 [Ordospora pajunii]
MDVEALRRSREIYVDEMNKVTDEMNEFIRINLHEIRDLLTVCAAKPESVGIDELRAFVEHRINEYIRLMDARKKDAIMCLAHGKTSKDTTDAIITADYCYRRLMYGEEPANRRGNRRNSREYNAEEERLDAFVNIITGMITIRYANSHESVVDSGSISCDYHALQDLFSNDFRLSISKKQMNVEMLNMKVEMGIEAFKIAVESPEDSLCKLVSYKACKEHGIPILVSSDDTIDMIDDELGHLHSRVQQQVNDVIVMHITDASKACLINYLLVILIGISRKVDLSYFNDKKEMYMLCWVYECSE